MNPTGKNNLNDIFITFRKKLLSFIRSRISSEEDAKDLLQDVFLRFLQTEEKITIEQVSAWLYKVTKNRITDYRRKIREEKLPSITKQTDDQNVFFKEITDILIEKDANPDQQYLRNLIWEEIEQAMDELPEEQRNVFEETEINGKSYKEIASATGISVKTLLSRKHYAVLYLRGRLKEIYESVLYDN
jgi:RNA polymerase sigma factor (sigma-70 family)